MFVDSPDAIFDNYFIKKMGASINSILKVKLDETIRKYAGNNEK